MFRKCVSYLNIFSFCWPTLCMAGMINPDGQTMTNVSVNGNTYNVTTGTVSGQNAFNSFSSFDVYQNATANLHLPEGTANLINLIHDKKTNIDGILNSYKNGQIGGNVFMLNPNGIVIGESGVVNVGSIAMSTPTHYFMQQVIQNGAVSETATKAILAGDMPLNKSGTVSVKGKIKALDKIAIQAGSIENRGELTVQTQLSDLVNTGDLNIEDQPLVFSKGKIAIASETDVVHAGKIAVKGKAGQKTGKVSIKAKNDIRLENGSIVAANGSGANSAGGEIYIMAQNNTSFEKGAVLQAKGGESGNGGFIELSAQKKVTLNGGSFDASAQNGQTGQVYIDPDEIEVNSQTSTNADIIADGRIITIKEGATLDAQTNDIIITAQDKNNVGKAGITVSKGAVLNGKNINLSAISSITGSKMGQSDEQYNADLFGIGDLSLSMFAGVSDISSEAYIDVAQSAQLIATNDVNLNVESEAKISMDVGPLALSAVFGSLTNTARLTVADDVTITGKNINLNSVAKSSVSLMAITIASGDSKLLSGASGSFAMAQMKSNNTIDIGNATVKAQQKLNIEATTQKAMNVSASTVGLITSSGAVDVAISTSKVNNTVAVGGKEISGKDVLINSEIHSVNVNSASGSAGMGNIGTSILGTVEGWAPNKLQQLVSKSAGKIEAKGEAKQAGKNEGTKAKIKVAGAVAYTDHENTAEAYIKENATVKATHDLDLMAKTYDVVANVSSAGVSGGNKDDNQASNGIAAAVAIADYTNTARAYIGQNATVDVHHRLNVHSEAVMPPKYKADGSSYFKIHEMIKGQTGDFWDDFLSSSQTLWGVIFDHVNTNLGIKDEFFNTWAKSSVSLSNPDDADQKFAISGSVNLVEYNNNSTAFIANGAKINQKNTRGSRVVDVNAVTDVMGVNMGGLFGLPSGVEAQEGVGIGASFVMADYNNATGAFIGDNVKLNAEGLNVSADLLNQNVSVAIGFGKSENMGLQGMFSFLNTENVTAAQISGGAQVNILGTGLTDYKNSAGKTYKDAYGNDKNYNQINLRAKDDSLFVNVSGDVMAKKGGKSLLAATTVNNVNRTTHAVWGDFKTGLMSGTALNQLNALTQKNNTTLYNLSAIGSVNGYLSSPQNVNVNADASGLNVAIAIAASVSTGGGDVPSVDKDFNPDEIELDDLDEVASEPADLTADKAKKKNQFGMGISASFAWNKFNNDVSSYTNNARTQNTSAPGSISLTASDVTQSYGVTGGVSAEANKGDTTNVAASASASYNNINSTVRSFGENASLTGIKNLSLSADNHTKMMGMAIGAAVSTTAQKGATLNGAVTVNEINNVTQAYLKNSTIIANSVDLSAKDDSWLLQMGVGVAASKNVGAGGVAGWNTSSSTTQTGIQDSAVNAVEKISLKAQNEMDIRSISTGGSASSKGAVSITGAYNDISNTTQAGLQNTNNNVKAITTPKLTISSLDDSDIVAVSTGAGGGKKLGASIVVGVNRINNTTEAILDSAHLVKDSSISPSIVASAISRGRIRSFANSVGVGQTGGIGNTGTYNDIYNTTQAKVLNSIIDGTSLSLNATDMSYILAETAGVGAAKGLGMGLAVSINRIGNTTKAMLENSTVSTTDSVSLTALNQPSDRTPEEALPTEAGDLGDTSKRSITTITVGAGVGNFGAGLSGVYSDVKNTTESVISGGNTTAGNVNLKAKDSSNILTVGVAAAGGKTAGVGGISTTNIVSNTVNAILGDKTDNLLTTVTSHENIRAEAENNSVIKSVAAGAAGGGTAGLAGIIAYNDISNTVSALIKKAALSSVGSIALLAKAVDTAQFYYGLVAGGGTFGGGGVVGLNYLGNKAYSTVENSTIHTAGQKALGGYNGLLVQADIDDEVSVYGGSAAGGGTVGVSGNVGFVQVQNESKSKIDNSEVSSSVNGKTTAANSGVTVLAHNDIEANIMTGSAAGAGSVGIGASAGTAVIKNTSEALISKSALDVAGNIAVKANNTTHYNSVIVTGAGGGNVGVVGSTGIGLINNQTTALVDETALHSDNNLTVDATSYTGLGKKGVPTDIGGTKDNAVAIGGIAGAGMAGVGVSVMVNQVNNTTRATVKNSALDIAHQTAVQANNTDEVKGYVVTGGIGGYAGVAGSVSVNNLNSSAAAGIESDKSSFTRNGKINQVAVHSGSIRVGSQNTANISNLMTTLGASVAAGVGAGIDVTTLKGSSHAYIKGKMPITAQDDVTVTASNSKDADIAVVTGGGAGIAGVSGAISVLNLGEGSYNSSEYTSGTSSETGQTTGVDNMIAEQLSANQMALSAVQNQDLMMSSTVKDTNIRKDDSLAVKIDSVEGNTTTQSTLASDTSKGSEAVINLSGNTVTSSSGSILVNANESVTSNQVIGGVAAGGIAAVGASVAVSNINTNTMAKIQNAHVSAGKNVTVDSRLNQDIKGQAFAAGAAGIAAVNGGVSVSNAHNITEAALGAGTEIYKAQDVLVHANSISTIDNQTDGASLAGIAGVGASVSTVSKSGETNAFIDEGVLIGTDDSKGTIQNVTVNAENESTALSTAHAATGGGIAGVNGTVATVTMTDKQNAAVKKNVQMALGNTLDVKTNAAQKATSTTIGASLGYVSVGASVSTANMTLDNHAVLDENVLVRAQNAKVTAYQSKAQLLAEALAAAGGYLVGVNGAVGTSSLKGSVSTVIGKGIQLVLNGLASFDSKLISDTKAQALGARAGLIAAGATVATANSAVTTETLLKDGQSIKAASLDVKAIADSTLESKTVSGSGGVVSGAAAVSTTDNQSTTRVLLGQTDSEIPQNNTYDLESFAVKAEHKLNQNGFADSINAALVGASGAVVNNNSQSTVAINALGTNKIEANDVLIEALNIYNKNSNDLNINSGSGGLIDAPAASSNTNTTHVTSIDFGNGLTLSRNQSRALANKKEEYKFVVNALNTIDAADQVKLVSGGAIPLARVVSKIIDNSTAKVNVNGANIVSAGDMIVNASGNVNIRTDASASTYGLASVASGSTRSESTQNNTIAVKENGSVFANGHLYLNAGQAKGTTSQKSTVNALTQLWNNTAIPISDNSAVARLNTNNLIDVQSNASIKSGSDAFLTSQQGHYSVIGQADSHNPYNEAFGTNVSTYDGKLNNKSKINIDGSVIAGVNNVKKIVIDSAGNVTVNGSAQDAEFYYREKNVQVYAEMQTQLDKLKQMLRDYGQSAEYRNYYTAEITALEAKMKSMGLLVEEFDQDGKSLGFEMRKDVSTDYLEIYDLYAGAGAVELVTNQLTGGSNGSISVTSGAEISIENNSNKFLELHDLIINERPNGTVRLNYQVAHSASDLGNGYVGQLKTNEGNVQEQSISVYSNYKQTGPNGQVIAPSIDILGSVTNYNGLVDIKNKAGSIYTSGAVRGKDIKLDSGGDIIQKSNEFVYHIGGDPSAAWGNIASGHENGNQSGPVKEDGSNYNSSIIASNNIYISGRYLDLNGLIQSGTANWKLNIADNNLSLISSNGSKLDINSAKTDYQNRVQSDSKTSSLYALSKDVHGNVNAYYNVLTGQIEIDDVRVQGGYIELNGHIMNTSSKGGELKVADGYGRLNINNNSRYDIVLNDISLGEKINGIIKITDTAQKGKDGNALVTIYKRNGNTITQETNGGEIKNISANINGDGISSTMYDVLGGQRYQWLTGLEHVTEKETTYNTKTFWGMDWIAPDEDDAISSHTWDKSATPLREGETVKLGVNTDNAYDFSRSDIDLTGWSEVGRNQWTETHGWWIFSTEDHYTRIWEQKGSKTYFEHSVKADNDVKISFQGFENASTHILSKSNILLKGDISNATGNASLTSQTGQIDSLSSLAQISAKDINLQAQTGIGDKNGVGINLLGGTLRAINNNSGDINLSSSSDITFDQIQNQGGNTIVQSAHNLLGVSESALITGKTIELGADYGRISTKDGKAFLIQTDATQNGTLSAFAADDIMLKQKNGDLGVKRIVSTNGNVSLDIAGSVYDANENQQPNLQTQEEMKKRWDNMGLTGLSGEALSDAISAFENQKTAEYREYWEIKNQLDSNGAFRYTEAQRQSFLTAGLTNMEIDGMETAKMSRFTELAGQYSGTSYQSDYKYIASNAEKETLAKGAGWNKSQLEYSFTAAKLDTNVGSQLETEEANIEAKNVTVQAGGSIGKDSGTLVLNLDNMEQWTDEQKMIFAAAERDNVSLAEDEKTVTISLREDLDVHADSVNLKASGYVYLGAEQDINIDQIQAGAGKDITIAGAGGIYNVAVTDKANVVGNNLVLEASKGDIGSADKELAVDLTGKINARAHGSIYLTAENGINKDLNVDYIYAPETVSLRAQKIADQRSDDLVNIRSHTIVLNAENIGSADNALDVSLDGQANALLTAEAEKDIYLKNAETTDLSLDVKSQNASIVAQNGNLNIHNIETKQNAVLTADNGNMTVDTLKAGNNVALMVGNGNLIAKTIESGNDAALMISGTGDMNVTSLTAQNKITATAHAGKVSLGSILSKAASVAIEALNGAINIDSVVAKTDAFIKALAGKVNVNKMIAARDVTVEVGTGETVLETVTAGNNATITVNNGNTELGTITATAGNADITVGTGTLTAAAINAGSTANVDVTDGQTSINALTAGTDAAVTVAKGNATLETVTAGNNAAVTVDKGNTELGTITATAGDADITVGAGTLTAAAINAGSDANIAVTEGQTSIDALTAGANASVTVDKGNTELGTIIATAGNAGITVGTGTLTAAAINAGSDANVAVTDGQTSIKALTGGTDVSVAVAKGNTMLETVTAGNNAAVTVDKGNTELGTITATAGDADITVGAGTLTAAAINAGSDANVDVTDGQTNIDALTAGANAAVTVAKGNTMLETVTAGNNAAVTVDKGNTELGTITATAGDADITVGAGTLTAAAINAGSDANVAVTEGQTSINALMAGKDAEVKVDNGNTELGTITATTGNAGITVGTGTLTTAAINAGSDANVDVTDGQTSINALTAGIDASVTVTKGNATLETVTAGNNTAITVDNGNTELGTITATTGNTDIAVGAGTLTANAINAGSDANVAVTDGQTNIDALTAGANASVTVDKGNTELGTIIATAGNAGITVGTGTLTAAAINAGSDANVAVTDGKTDVNIIRAENNATITVDRGDIALNTITANNDIILNNQIGDIALSQLTAGNDILINGKNGSLDIEKSQALNDILVKNNDGTVTVIDMSAGANVTFDTISGDLLLGHVDAANGNIDLSVEKGSVYGLNDGITLTSKEVNFTAIGGQIGKENHVMQLQADKAYALAEKDVFMNLWALDKSATESSFGTIESKLGNIHLTAKNENAGLTGEIRAHNGHVDLIASHSIIDHLQSDKGTIQSNTMNIVASDGRIASEDRYLKVDSSYTQAGWIDAMADQGIYIDEVQGDMNVRHFASKNGDINMKIDAGIQGIAIGPDEAHFKADNITLHSNNGRIGMPGQELVLEVNDSLPGFINLKAAHGIAFRKTTPNLWSNYMEVTQDGKITGIMPTGMARIAYLYSKDGSDFIFDDAGAYSNLWVSKIDLENKMIDGENIREPQKININEMRKPFFDQYKIQYRDGERNEVEQEEWLNGLLSFLQER